MNMPVFNALSVSENCVDEIIKMLPAERSSYDSFKATELHPVDFEKQSELCKQIKRILG